MQMERDMDLDKGRKYYTSPSMIRNDAHDSRMGRNGMSRRTYMEYTEMHNTNTQEEKDNRAKLRKEHIRDLKEDLKEMMASVPQDEKQAWKSELNMMMQEF